MAGSGNWAEGAGFCGEGSGFCPGGAGFASGGGGGFWGVVWGLCPAAVGCEVTASCEAWDAGAAHAWMTVMAPCRVTAPVSNSPGSVLANQWQLRAERKKCPHAPAAHSPAGELSTIHHSPASQNKNLLFIGFPNASMRCNLRDKSAGACQQPIKTANSACGWGRF